MLIINYKCASKVLVGKVILVLLPLLPLFPIFLSLYILLCLVFLLFGYYSCTYFGSTYVYRPFIHSFMDFYVSQTSDHEYHYTELSLVSYERITI